ncbi:hypothetical protein CRE_29331 [Caenorhabditis remanei]|uniref:F-box domain-containing protein n=1 Tax=Caenorhabditis remanei TaxID=31234 RepID=E3MXY2_CAERE|nr:hypothetical protein CRE_29331 [Caenorhabditis remanei]
MTEYFKSDPIAMRHAILYEFVGGKPIFETYKKLCERLGVVDYLEFEFWFMRFVRGEFDINHDKNLEPKTRTINDLPVRIFEEIGTYLDVDDRYNLRHVSKNIQRIVDTWKPDIDFLYFDKNMPEDKRRKLAYLLRNPKLELKSLLVLFSDNRSAELVVSVLKEIEHPVRVEVFTMMPVISEAAKIISKLDSKSLKMVGIRINDGSVKNMNELLQLEQIKRLDHLFISTDLEPSQFPLQSFYNCSVFHIEFFEVKNLKPLISFIKNLLKSSTNLLKCYFSFDVYRPREKFFRKVFSKLGTGDLKTRRVSIPGTKDFYKLEYSNIGITVTRES